MNKPNPVTLGKAVVHAQRFEKTVDAAHTMLKKEVVKMIAQLDAKIPELVDRTLALAVANQEPELMKILQASEGEQEAYLHKAKVSLGLIKSASTPLKTVELPSSEEILNKIMPGMGQGPPFYAHQFDPNAISKMRENFDFSGVSVDEINRRLQREATSSIRKSRGDLMKQAGDAPETEVHPGDAANFMVACIQARMASEGSTMDEAKDWCESYLKEKLNIDQDPDGKQGREHVLDVDYDRMRKTMEECVKRKREADPNLTEEEALLLCEDDVEKGKVPSAERMFHKLTKRL